MRIEKIGVKNFRSIEAAELEPTGFNICVGQNNHGKTNFFDAIEWFYLGKGSIADIRRRGTDEIVEVDVTFCLASEGLNVMRNDTAKAKLGPYISEEDKLRVRRNTEGDTAKKFEIFDPATNSFGKLPSGMDNSLLDLLPKFEYVKTQTNLRDVSKYGKTTPIGEMLSGVLNVILEQNPKYREFKEKFEELFGANDSEVKMELDGLSGKVKVYLEKQFPDCTEVEFEVKEPAFDDLLKNFETKVDDGVKTDAMEKGDGMQRAIMLAILQTYADFRKENDTKPFIFLIDEGELHLHPTAQRKLKTSLLDLIERGDQVFLNTHSSVLVVDGHDEQSIFTVEKTDCISHFEKSTEEAKASIIYDLLGGSPSDLLLPRNFIIVEGESEFQFFSRVIPRLYDTKGIQIIKAFGDIDQAARSINAVIKTFSPLNESLYKDKVVILLDKLSDAKISKNSLGELLQQFPVIKEKSNLFILDEANIEEYYPVATPDQTTGRFAMPTWKRTHDEAEGMNSNTKVRLAKEVGAKITVEQITTEMPMVDNLIKKTIAQAFQ
jgi:putative ATP-dependent endonuclease of OLD family